MAETALKAGMVDRIKPLNTVLRQLASAGGRRGARLATMQARIALAEAEM